MSGLGMDAWLSEREAEESRRLAHIAPGQRHLAAMLHEIAMRIANGSLGDVTDCVLFIRGMKAAAVITLPKEPIEETLNRLEDATIFLKSGELPPRSLPWQGCPQCTEGRNPECPDHGNIV